MDVPPSELLGGHVPLSHRDRRLCYWPKQPEGKLQDNVNFLFSSLLFSPPFLLFLSLPLPSLPFSPPTEVGPLNLSFINHKCNARFDVPQGLS